MLARLNGHIEHCPKLYDRSKLPHVTVGLRLTCAHDCLGVRRSNTNFSYREASQLSSISHHVRGHPRSRHSAHTARPRSRSELALTRLSRDARGPAEAQRRTQAHRLRVRVLHKGVHRNRYRGAAAVDISACHQPTSRQIALDQKISASYFQIIALLHPGPAAGSIKQSERPVIQDERTDEAGLPTKGVIPFPDSPLVGVKLWKMGPDLWEI